MDHTEQSILKVLNTSFLSCPKYLINNLFVFFWESDYLALTKSGYWYEIEVKISRADFRADFKKEDKHRALSGRINPGSKNYSNTNHSRPNYFYYAVPEGMITIDEVPEYAGLIYIIKDKYTTNIRIEKKAPTIHKEKNSLDLSDKFYYNWKNVEHKVRNLEIEIEELREKQEHSPLF